MFTFQTNLGDGNSARMAPYFNQLLLPKAIVPQELSLNSRHLCFTIKDRQRNKLHWQRAHDTHGISLPEGTINKSCSCFDINGNKVPRWKLGGFDYMRNQGLQYTTWHLRVYSEHIVLDMPSIPGMVPRCLMPV